MTKLISGAVVVLSLYTAAGAAIAPQSTQATVDARPNFPPSAAHVGRRVVPNLAALRAGFLETPPVPGGIGAGTLYSQRSLRVTSRAELYTQMIVHPTGIGVANFIFTTATNRTELTIEVVGIYIGTGAALGVFDWSCLPGYRCPNGSTEPSWQWTRDLNELPCYYRAGDDGGGHVQNLLSYVNRSQRQGNDVAPPAPVENWRNSVLLLNHCTNEWDLVYSHSFRAAQKDCSVDSSCGWWGPIIETFNDDPQPSINELGFFGSTLRYDNQVSSLSPVDTLFSLPNPPWFLFHIDPNRSWAAGSFTGQ
jgi:hypothetical protein